MAVYENQPCARERAKSEMAYRVAGKPISGSLENGLKRQFRNRRDISEAPVLVIDGGETELGKTRQSGLPQWEHPRRLFRFVFKTGESLQIRLSFLHIGFLSVRNGGQIE